MDPRTIERLERLWRHMPQLALVCWLLVLAGFAGLVLVR